MLDGVGLADFMSCVEDTFNPKTEVKIVVNIKALLSMHLVAIERWSHAPKACSCIQLLTRTATLHLPEDACLSKHL